MAPGSTGPCFTGVEASSQAAQAPLMPSGSHKVIPVGHTSVLLNVCVSVVSLGIRRLLCLFPHTSKSAV